MSDAPKPDLNDDDVLLAELRAAVTEGDGVPAAARDLANAAFDLGRVDAELADLLFDSLLDAPEVATRGPVLENRTIAFIAGGVRLDLDLIGEDGGLLLGQIHPASAASVVLERSDGQATTSAADDLGRFQVPMTFGCARLRITLANGANVVTPWITF